jgi:diguanylate cyclase (GGDEF)-like protein
MGDPHFGMLSWEPETGVSFDLAKAEAVTFGAVDMLTSLTPSSETALLLNLGDYFHADDSSNRTPRGQNMLDVDGRFQKVASVGFRAMIRCIERLLEKHAKVIVRNNPGNHDPHQALMLNIAIGARFHNEPRVYVDPSPSPFYYYRHGTTLIGSTHGDGPKLTDLPLLMANDARDDWAASDYRVWHVGHFHHNQRLSQKDLVGCEVETHRTLAATDAWHHHSGYRSQRDMKAIIYSKTDGEVIRIVGTIADVTEAKTSQERLLHDAVHDNLTGLPNRSLFFDRLDAALIQASQDPRMRPAVLVVDVDRFKQVNEDSGLSAGDSILLTLSRRLSRLLRPQDSLARIAGDNFAVILMSEREPERVMAFAEMIRRALSTPVTYAEREIFFTASIGVALHDAQLTKREEIFKNAEIAMAHAKRQGGDRIEIYRPTMREGRDESLMLSADLRRALENNEMKIVFQPVVRLEDRTIAGFEALLRWDHPKRGRILPAVFIPLAEESGMIADLGLFALDRTASELAAWQSALQVDPPIFASVKVPSRQLMRHDLINDVKNVLARSGVEPGSLKLEFSESMVMENPEYAAQLLCRIRDLGAGLLLDDFATGYSAFSYLERFPFDMLKIDQSFVRDLGNGNNPVILRSIVKMAQELGMEVVAEAAESESDAIELFQIGCDYAQGYVFGEPISPAQARQIVGGATEAA